ncbi:hypothetical protein LH612_31250, partial [Klebsiella pneumoniae]|nr:hypothetical protein [Klebsiella pneumoniae]
LLGTLTAALARQLGWSRLALSSAPVRDALTAASAADLLPLVGAGVAVGLLPALHAGLESFRSTALAMLRERELPAFLGRTSSAGTPYLLDLAAGLTAAVLALLGVPRLVLAVNKIDMVDFDESVYTKISEDFVQHAEALGYSDDAVVTIPVSALHGDNVVERSERTPWYSGPSLLEHLETVPVAPDPYTAP